MEREGRLYLAVVTDRSMRQINPTKVPAIRSCPARDGTSRRVVTEAVHGTVLLRVELLYGVLTFRGLSSLRSLSPSLSLVKS